MRLQTFPREGKQSRTTGYLTSSLIVIIDLVLLPKDFLKLKALTLMNYSLQLSAMKLHNCFLLLLHLRIQISKALTSKQPTYMVIWMRKSTWNSQKISNYLRKKTKSGNLSYNGKYPFNNIISFLFYIITNFSLLNSCCLLLQNHNVDQLLVLLLFWTQYKYSISYILVPQFVD